MSDEPNLDPGHTPDRVREHVIEGDYAGRHTSQPEQPALRRQNTRRWLLPAAALSVAMLIFFSIGLTIQLVVPIIGIAITLGIFIAMIVASRRLTDGRTRMITLASLMLGLALTMLVCGATFYFIEAFGFVVPGGSPG